MADLETTPGVLGVTAMPDSAIAASIKRQVAEATALIPEGHTVAMVGIATKRGMNLALVARKESERWGDVNVSAWIGKTGWDAPIDRGVSLMWSK